MALKIRLRQQGRTNRPFYRLVVADSRSPRDGKYVECIGWYNPFEEELEKRLLVREDRLDHWLDHGAQLSEKAEALCLQVAPNAVKKNTDRMLAKKAKMTAKKRAARKKAAAK